MPEPTNDPIVSDDPKFGNGANAESTDHTTPPVVRTLEDQQRDTAQKLKTKAKILAGNELKRTAPNKKRGW